MKLKPSVLLTVVLGRSTDKAIDCTNAGICTRIYDPVCGADGETYANDCMRKLSFCEGNSDAESMIFKGTCADFQTKCRHKLGKCSKVYKPICGSDGVTYGNNCMLNLKNCDLEILIENSLKITKKHKGECQMQPVHMLEPPNVNLKFGFPGSKCFCSRMMAPVCGTDNKTYSNSCMAECQDAQIKRHCRCELSSCMMNDMMINSGRFSPPEEEEEEEEEEEIEPVGCTCQRDFRPVCALVGDTYQTYSNECEAKCQEREIVRYCPCEQDTCILNDIMINQGKIEREEPEEPEEPEESDKPCICNRLLKLVCGSDGITYNNPCLAGCKNAEVVKGCRCEEECPSLVEEENADYDPELPRIDPPETPKFCPCGRDYRPVCGSDGKTYSNGCNAECANVQIEYSCDCEKVSGGRCVQMANDPFGFGFDPFAGFGNDFEEPEFNKCDKDCFGEGGESKCALINGEYNEFSNWCTLDVALCKNGGSDSSETKACGMKRNGAFKIFPTGCQAEKWGATVVDMSLCDGARDYPQDKKQKRRMQNDIFSGDITTSNWRFRLIGRR